MDAQGTIRLMFGTMDAYDRADFDRLAEIYAEDATPTEVLLTARVNGFDPVVTVFSFQGRHIAAVRDYPSMEAAESALAGPRRAPAQRWWRRWWRRRRPGSRR
jgi:hypothetical protein